MNVLLEAGSVHCHGSIPADREWIGDATVLVHIPYTVRVSDYHTVPGDTREAICTHFLIQEAKIVTIKHAGKTSGCKLF